MADLSIMYQPISGGWVKLGTQSGGGRGVVAESIRLEGDRGEGGCLSCSFKLKQDPRWIQTEMEKATPIVVMDGAEHVWSGRIAETPMTFGDDDIEVGVNAQGWWQHLKDDCTDREWVVADLSRFIDTRSMSLARLTDAEEGQKWNVSIDGHEVMLGGAKDTTFATNSRCSVTIDLGPNNKAYYVSVDWKSSNNAGANTQLYVVGHDSGYWATAPQTTGTAVNNNAGVSGTLNQALTAGYRYVTIMHYAGTGFASVVDFWFKLAAVRIFTDASDHSAGASILKASTVISETLDACAPLISSDRSRITTTSLSLPQFPGSPGWKYADELIKQANAPHGYLARLTPEPVPVFEYGPIPTDYRFVLGEAQYTLLEPAAQALQGVASRVITEYEDASGVRSHAISMPIPTAGVDTVLSSSQWTNPSFDTNTTGWTVTSGTLTRDTGVFDTSPASGRLTTNGGGIAIYYAAGPTLRPNTNYIIRVRYRREQTLTSATVAGFMLISDGTKDLATATGAWDLARLNALPLSTWTNIDLPITTSSTGVVNLSHAFSGPSATICAYIDSVQVLESNSTVIERRGFRRTFLRPMSQRSTLATAQAISDLELDAAQFPPFKGTIGVTGRIPLKGGGSMDVSHLPACVGDNILLSNLHDPNSQGLGRIGNIQTCVYDHEKRQAIIGIDRDLSFITQLRERLTLLAR